MVQIDHSVGDKFYLLFLVSTLKVVTSTLDVGISKVDGTGGLFLSIGLCSV